MALAKILFIGNSRLGGLAATRLASRFSSSHFGRFLGEAYGLVNEERA